MQPTKQEIDALLYAGERIVTEEFPNVETKVVQRSKSKGRCMYYSKSGQCCLNVCNKKYRDKDSGLCKTKGVINTYKRWYDE